MKLGLGTVQFGQAYGVSNARGQVARGDAATILQRAAGAGVAVLDTAANYGEAESVLAALDTSPFRIVTKTVSGDAGSVAARARASKAALPNADTLLVHAAAGLDDPALWPALQRLKAEGVFARIGISTYVADNPLALAERFRPDVMQLPFSLLDQRLLRDGTLARLADMGVEIHARSLFLQGLLLMAPQNVPENLGDAAPHLAALRARVGAAGTTMLAAALGFVLSRPEVAIALLGVTGLDELDEILVAADQPLPHLDWDACALADERILTPSLWNRP